MSKFVHKWWRVLNVGFCCNRIHTHLWAIVLCGGTVGWGNVLQAGRLQVRFPMVSHEFFLWSFWPHYGPDVDSASNRNKYQEYFLGSKGGWCVGLTTLPPSCAVRLGIWESPGTLMACPGLYRNFFALLFVVHPGQLSLQYSAWCLDL